MSVGSQLRKHRVEQGLELEELADYLRIQQNYLEAIEGDDFEALPGSAYAAGFIRTYARQLGLDSEKAVRAFQREHQEAAAKPDLIMRVPLAESHFPTWTVLIAATVMIGLIMLGWSYFHRDDRQLADAVPPVPARLSGASESPPSSAAQTETANAQPATDTMIPSPGSYSSESDTPDEASDDVVSAPAHPLAAVTPVPAAPASTVVNSDAGQVAGAGSRVEIHAIDSSWVQIRDASGDTVFSGVLYPGQVYRVPDVTGYSMVAGNAGGMQLQVDGVLTGRLGATGQVMRNIPLDPARLASVQRTQ